MENKEIIRRLNSIELCMTAHPDNLKGSEFEDRINDLIEIIEALNIHNVSNQRKLLICDGGCDKNNFKLKCSLCGKIHIEAKNKANL